MKQLYLFVIFGMGLTIAAHVEGSFLTASPFFSAENDTVFLLYTRRNPMKPQILKLNDVESMSDSNFDAHDQIRFIIHGWNGDGYTEFNSLTRQAYMNSGSFNVIVVDWSAGAKTLNYLAARNRVSTVGMVVAKFIDFLAMYCGVLTEKISIVGHGLGAHVAGMTGKHTTAGQVHTIFGLDPARPLFSIDRPTERLTAQDAQYVESIVTSGGVLAMFEPSGISTFYPNGGARQPGCGQDITGICSHDRAYEYFAESINTSIGFWAKKCRDFTGILVGVCTPSGPAMMMGGEPSNYGHGAEGIYWVNTNSESPFAIGQ